MAIRSFNAFIEEKSVVEPLAILFVENDIDVEEFCDFVLESAEEGRTEDQILNEFLGALRDMLGGAANAAKSSFGNVGAGIGKGANAAAGAVGNAARQGANAVGGVARQGLNAAAQGANAVGGAIKQGANAVGQAAKNSAQPVVNSYMQGAQGSKIKQTVSALNSLTQQLQGMQLKQGPQMVGVLKKIQMVLQRELQNTQGDATYRLGQNA